MAVKEEDVKEEASAEPEQPKTTESTITEAQWLYLRDTLEGWYAYREPDGNDPSKLFQKRVNKRNVPDYYDVIKEPMAFSNLRAAIQQRDAPDVEAYIRLCALIWHNAHIYNRPKSQAFVDATTIKKLMERDFQQAVKDRVFTAEQVAWPDLGEIPPVEDAQEGGEDEDEEEEDEEDEEEEDEEGSDDDGKRKRGRGRPVGTAARKESGAVVKKDQKPRRGRPPKVDTPLEARMRHILKGMRKPRNENRELMILAFEKLPDKAALPDYYLEIRNPISIEQIKRNSKRKRYTSVAQFMEDVNLMFENAKLYNADESQVYRDAVKLQIESQRLAAAEMAKSDSEYGAEEGRRPRPEGITHNGELWQVGDWVTIRNPNDVTKPLIAQVYRTWEDDAQQEWVNACWYYRPEQTVHQYEKHFFVDEVVKTGQYRDHRIEDIVGRCFVMFITRYTRGRPRGLPADRQIYVCEARYNEEKHKMNKIKTWASCLPDEVRDSDYEMDLFEGTRKFPKVPSPLLYMLKDDAKEGEIPQPTWGIDNAPPIIGGIYKGPRDENQSPPPEVMPPSMNPVEINRRLSQVPTQAASSYDRPAHMPDHSSQSHGHSSHMPSTDLRSALSPMPLMPRQNSSYNTSTPQHMSSMPLSGGSYNQNSSYGSGQSRYGSQSTTQQQRYQPAQAPMAPPSTQKSPDVYILPDQANQAIPEDLRKQYQCDEQGRLLFFNKPPVDVIPVAQPGSALGHSVRYIAAKAKRRRLLAMQNAAKTAENGEEEKTPETNSASVNHNGVGNHVTAQEAAAERELALANKFIVDMCADMQRGTQALYQKMYGANWEAALAQSTANLKVKQEIAQRERRQLELERKMMFERAEQEKRDILKPQTTFKDDYDPRV